MSKITLTNLADLNNQNSVVTNINNNNTTLVNAFDNTLSRDGTSPNQMAANLDMNSYKIVNLAAPTNNADAVRFQDIGDAVAASVAADASAASAASSATAASTSASAASTSASNASASATSAATSATAASNSAATASASYAGIRFTYDTSTSMADPGTGKIRFNNATLSSASQVAMSHNSADSGNPAINAYVLTWDDSTNTSNKGNFILRKLGTPGTYAVFSITSVTDNSTWLQIAVTYVGGNGSWSASDSMSLDFNRSGDKGADGTMTGPGVSVDSEIALFSGTSGTSLKRATQTGILKGASGVIGTATAGTDYAAPGANTDITSVLLSNTGLKVKDVGGSFNLDFKPGSTLTANRTLTVTTGDSDRTLTLGGNATVSQDYSTTGNPQFATIELGNATDTTISRSSAGVIAVEGVTVPLNSTSSVHTASTIELGNASDTTLSRASAGVLAVEGVNVITTAANANLTGGFTTTSYNAGTKSSGTFTPDPTLGNIQHATNGGAHTIAPPSSVCTMVIEYTNSSAGALTTSGYTFVTGDVYSTSGTKKHIFYITKTNSYSQLHINYVTGT